MENTEVTIIQPRIRRDTGNFGDLIRQRCVVEIGLGFEQYKLLSAHLQSW